MQAIQEIWILFSAHEYIGTFDDPAIIEQYMANDDLIAPTVYKSEMNNPNYWQVWNENKEVTK